MAGTTTTKTTTKTDWEPISITPKMRDPAWKHCEIFKKDGQNLFLKKCLYCGKLFQGGGIYRFKEHLAGRKGNGVTCNQVPKDVRVLINNALRDVSNENSSDGAPSKKRRKKNMERIDNGIYGAPPVINQYDGDNSDVCIPFRFEEGTARDDEMGSLSVDVRENDGEFSVDDDCVSIDYSFADMVKMADHKDGNKMVVDDGLVENHVVLNIPSVALEGRMNNGSEYDGIICHDRLYEVPVIDDFSMMDEMSEKRPSELGKKAKDGNNIINNGVAAGNLKTKDVHLAIGRFLYEIGADLAAVRNSIYFQPMIDAIASCQSLVAGPSYHDLRGWILRSCIKEVKSSVEQCQETWERSGCSILVNQYMSANGKILLNFSVSSLTGAVFWKSVDATGALDSTDSLYEMLKLVVEEVGSENVLQVITPSEKNYALVGKRLMDTFPFLFWTPCAGYCIDLILKDFAEIDWIKSTLEEARHVTRFIYSNAAILNMMRWYTHDCNIIVIGERGHAVDFRTIKCIADHRDNLEKMFVSEEWMNCPLSKCTQGMAVSDIINKKSFLKSCSLIVRLVDPLLQVLNMISSGKKAAMGYLLAGFYRVKELIKKELSVRRVYMYFWNIIDQRAEQLWCHPLPAAGFYLNPKLFYSVKGDIHGSIPSGLLDCVERLVPDTDVQDKIVQELQLYKNAVGDFGRKITIRDRDTMDPGQWWSTYGGCCPHLSKLAIRIISQTCSALWCKRNQFLNLNDTEDSLEHQCQTDLLFVQHNLWLRQLGHDRDPELQDPISVDNIYIGEDWAMEKEENSEDKRNSDWISVDPPISSKTCIGTLPDIFDDGDSGFDDYEVFDKEEFRETILPDLKVPESI